MADNNDQGNFSNNLNNTDEWGARGAEDEGNTINDESVVPSPQRPNDGTSKPYDEIVPGGFNSNQGEDLATSTGMNQTQGTAQIQDLPNDPDSVDTTTY